MRFAFAAGRAFQALADCQQRRRAIEVMERGERQRVHVLLVTAAVTAQPDLLAETRHAGEGHHFPCVISVGAVCDMFRCAMRTARGSPLVRQVIPTAQTAPNSRLTRSYAERAGTHLEGDRKTGLHPPRVNCRSGGSAGSAATEAVLADFIQ